MMMNYEQVTTSYIDDKGGVLAIENWKTMMQRYLDYAKAKGITPGDVTRFAG